ncbi:protein ALP1-like [Selaginella moellendorffii]|uniref:protein ALP1-like n=1 Tax=Selaginella moellendorffii TaxID=88036 RepID=UPI000D1CCA1A|nr:protein ALP1-like [Selaginella moellendorffii]|eukprot:XP_024527583.1 protein ALP1-like [Selaginella moellendorffii]
MEDQRYRKQVAMSLIMGALIYCRNASKRRFDRRKSAIVSIVSEIQQGILDGAPAKSTWVRDMLMHHTDTWDTTIFPQYDDGQFWKDFRCTKATFEWLCFTIFQPCGFEGNRTGPNWRVISLRRRVAMLLWRLLHGGREHAIAKIFFCDQSTVNKIVHKGLGIIAKHWTDAYIGWPTGDRARDIAAKFELETGFPSVIGAVDGSHIPITTPSIDRSNYYNDKSFHSMILMGAVDQDGFFLEIDAGLCGSLHDSQALASSRIARRAGEGLIDQQGYHLVGDSAFNPPRPWLMCPYRGGGQLTPQQESFNQALASARASIERAFCQLKSRFRVLLKKMEGDLDTTVQMIGVCCTLHNMLLSQNESADPAWIEESRQALESTRGVSSSGREPTLEQAAAEVMIATAGLQELESATATSDAARLARVMEPLPLPAGFNHTADMQRAREIRDGLAEMLYSRKRQKT